MSAGAGRRPPGALGFPWETALGPKGTARSRHGRLGGSRAQPGRGGGLSLLPPSPSFLMMHFATPSRLTRRSDEVKCTGSASLAPSNNPTTVGPLKSGSSRTGALEVRSTHIHRCQDSGPGRCPVRSVPLGRPIQSPDEASHPPQWQSKLDSAKAGLIAAAEGLGGTPRVAAFAADTTNVEQASLSCPFLNCQPLIPRDWLSPTMFR